MTEHCGECGSEVCGHGNCPQCSPCTHCNGGDRDNKFFGYGRDGYERTYDSSQEAGEEDWR